MTDTTGTLDAYLAEVRARLRALPEGQVSEILEELRSHVRESGAGPAPTDREVAAVLGRLGSPAGLASLYLTDRLLARAERSRSPWLLLSGLFRWTAVSIVGAFALVPVLAGHLIAARGLIAAFLKPFAPDRVGLWRLSGDEISLRLGLGTSPPPSGQELLGWWIVPLGLFMGAFAFWLTLSFGRWAIRARRSPLASIH